ncbi:MAG: tRNA pseudouridine(55) synthase TruB [Bacilli bacterium]|nr:tRNA pseudouridine(55) synthase TruB [Bacilli bacterium]
MNNYNGILMVNKPSGITSRDVINIVGKTLNTKKVGHTGTLDPMATGVLVLCLGNALKVCELITANDKEYIAKVILGIETETLDTTSPIINTKKTNITKEEIEKVLNSFKGSYLQEVPKYSAVKINGKKLYEYAREGKEIELPKKMVTIYDIQLISDITYYNDTTTFYIKTTVSKGTYIRSLIRDIGYKLNTYGCMDSLERTRQGIFNIDNSNTLEEIKNNNYKLLSIEESLPNIPLVEVDNKTLFKIRNGVKLKKFFTGDMAIIKDKNKVVAIYKNDLNESKLFKMIDNSY